MRALRPSTPVDASPPSHRGERLAMIDALRGAALAGVLLVNLGGFSLYYFLDDAARAALPTARVDAWLGMAVQLLVQDKAITVFSLLFGLGLALQGVRAEAQGMDVWMQVRRLLVLLAIGLLHAHLLWWGDILTLYALAGLLWLALRRFPDRALLLAGLSLGLFWFLLAPVATRLQPAGFADETQMHAAAFAAFSGPDLRSMLRGNLAYAYWNWLALWGVFPFVFARVLLGAWTGRKRVLEDPATHRPLLRWICAVGIGVGFAASVAIEWIDAAGLTDYLLRHGRAAEFALRGLRRIAPLALGLGYAAGFALLFMRPRAKRWLVLLAPVGRMALSHYLLQSAICVWLFYGIGLGLGASGGYPARFATWSLLFAAQVALSHWWLARFRHGPVEWLWRSLAEGRRLPMRIARSASE